MPVPSLAPAEIGLRERKKLGTRAALVRAAIERFDEYGVDATTVDDIAAAVDVSARTFHRYFGTKDDVLFADSAAIRDQFAGFLAARPPGEAVLDSLEAAALDMARHLVDDSDQERRRLRLVRGTPSLAARNAQQGSEWTRLVAEHVAVRLDQSPDDPLSTLLAACTIAALRTAVDRWIESPDSDYRAELGRCFELLGDLRAATRPSRSRSPR